MNKIIEHPFLDKGNKKFVSCWLGFHKWEIDEVVPCVLRQDGESKGSCNVTLYYCKKCMKQKMTASEIHVDFI